MNTFALKIVTPEGVVYEDDVLEVLLPSTSGQIGILPGHIPLISRLQAGEIVVKKTGGDTSLAASSGFVEVRPGNQVYVVVDTAERAEHIDATRAQAAYERAQELLKQAQSVEDVQFALVQAKIEKELARLGVAKKYRP